MKSLVRFLAVLGRIVVIAWPVAWMIAWWLWPPAPRAGWQIPDNERGLGFLDDEHILTEERVADGDGAKPTGAMRVWNIGSGRLQHRYERDVTFRIPLLVHHRYVVQRKKVEGKSVNYFVNWPHDLEE